LTIKEIEEQLKRVKKGNDLIQRLQLKYQSLDNGLLSGSNQFTTRVKTSKTNTTEDKILEALELKDEIVEQMQAIMDERIATTKLIDQLDEIEEWLVLTMLYVNNLPMAKVCKDLDFSKIQIYRIKKKAIENLVKVKNANR
jgi:holliday junction DNA helicase motor protein